MQMRPPPAVLTVKHNASLPSSTPLALVNTPEPAGLGCLRRFVGLGSHYLALSLHGPFHVGALLPITCLRMLRSCMLHQVLEISVLLGWTCLGIWRLLVMSI